MPVYIVTLTAYNSAKPVYNLTLTNYSSAKLKCISAKSNYSPTLPAYNTAKSKCNAAKPNYIDALLTYNDTKANYRLTLCENEPKNKILPKKQSLGICEHGLSMGQKPNCVVFLFFPDMNVGAMCHKSSDFY